MRRASLTGPNHLAVLVQAKEEYFRAAKQRGRNSGLQPLPLMQHSHVHAPRARPTCTPQLLFGFAPLLECPEHLGRARESEQDVRKGLHQTGLEPEPPYWFGWREKQKSSLGPLAGWLAGSRSCWFSSVSSVLSWDAAVVLGTFCCRPVSEKKQIFKIRVVG